MAESASDDSIDERAARVRLVVLDVDGVLTDGGLFYTEEGEALKRFDVRDGLGIKLMQHAGIDVAVISARASGSLQRRIADLGIVHFRTGCRDKRTALEALTRDLGLSREAVCFVGDDLLDCPALGSAGFAVAVADAHATAKGAAHWITAAGGGRGAVREVADRLLRARGVLESVTEGWLAEQAARAATSSVSSAAAEGRASSAENEAPSPSFGVIIPARYASTRLPGKPLLELGGKPMIVRVLENALASGAAFVVVATDDERIARAVSEAGGETVLTSKAHPSGTDRLAEVVQVRGIAPDTIVVNVQGDEPLLDPAVVRRVAENLSRHQQAGMATLATPFTSEPDLANPNAVKVVRDQRGMALYFSRSPIPFARQGTALGVCLRHVGIYAYRAATLGRLAAAPPADIERLESLEQLRALWLGISIHVDVIDEMPAHGVDTEEDLARVREAFGAR